MEEFKFVFQCTGDRDAFFNTAKTHLGDQLSYERKEWTNGEVVLKGIWLPVFVAIFAWFFWLLADDLALGNEFEPNSGRSQLFWDLMKPVLEFLGPIGTIAVGVVFVAWSVVWLIRRIQQPPIMHSIEPKRGRAKS